MVLIISKDWRFFICFIKRKMLTYADYASQTAGRKWEPNSLNAVKSISRKRTRRLTREKGMLDRKQRWALGKSPIFAYSTASKLAAPAVNKINNNT